MSTDKEGFLHDGDAVEGFSASCNKCGSIDVSIMYEFNYYGGATGYDHRLSLKCRWCGYSYKLLI